MSKNIVEFFLFFEFLFFLETFPLYNILILGFCHFPSNVHNFLNIFHLFLDIFLSFLNSFVICSV